MIGLEELEMRIAPDSTPLPASALIAEAQAIVGVLNLQANLLAAAIPAPQPTLFGNLQGFILTSNLLTQTSAITGALMQDFAQVALTGTYIDVLANLTTLGPRG
jgi:hypothetical protein